MICVCEFEFVPSADLPGGYAVLPFGLGGATQGLDWDDAVYMAVDWLKTMALDGLMQTGAVPKPRLQNEPEHGGKVVTIAVDVDLSDVEAVTAAEASRRLGVSRARVTQLCEAGRLESFTVGATRMVTVDSIECRLADRKNAVTA